MPVVLIKKKKKDSRENICFGGRGFINYSKDRLSDSLTNATKEIFRSTYDPNECCDLMQTFLEDFLDQTCPRKTFQSRGKAPAWITHNIITLSNNKFWCNIKDVLPDQGSGSIEIKNPITNSALPRESQLR